MPLSNYALDTFVSQDLSTLKECRATPVGGEFPDRMSWLSSFVLGCMFQFPLPREKAALAFALIRRAEGAVEEYDRACEALKDLTDGKKTISGYFRCLRMYESTVSMLYQGLDFARKSLKTKLFESGDGSAYDRLNRIYNKSRHYDPQRLPERHLHAVWIKNDGLYIEDAVLSFDELRNMVAQVALIADSTSKCRVNV